MLEKERGRGESMKKKLTSVVLRTDSLKEGSSLTSFLCDEAFTHFHWNEKKKKREKNQQRLYLYFTREQYCERGQNYVSLKIYPLEKCPSCFKFRSLVLK